MLGDLRRSERSYEPEKAYCTCRLTIKKMNYVLKILIFIKKRIIILVTCFFALVAVRIGIIQLSCRCFYLPWAPDLADQSAF